jgi:hypothetical protein
MSVNWGGLGCRPPLLKCMMAVASARKAAKGRSNDCKGSSLATSLNMRVAPLPLLFALWATPICYSARDSPIGVVPSLWYSLGCCFLHECELRRFRLQTPFAEVYDGCGECEKSSKRKEQGLQALITWVESSSLGIVSCQFEIRIEWPIVSVVVSSPANSKFEWPVGLLLLLLSVVIGGIGGMQILFTTIHLCMSSLPRCTYVFKITCRIPVARLNATSLRPNRSASTTYYCGWQMRTWHN